MAEESRDTLYAHKHNPIHNHNRSVQAGKRLGQIPFLIPKSSPQCPYKLTQSNTQRTKPTRAAIPASAPIPTPFIPTAALVGLALGAVALALPEGLVEALDEPVGEVTVGLAEVPVLVELAVGTGVAVELPAALPVAAGVVAEPLGVMPANEMISKRFTTSNE